MCTINMSVPHPCVCVAQGEHAYVFVCVWWVGSTSTMSCYCLYTGSCLSLDSVCVCAYSYSVHGCCAGDHVSQCVLGSLKLLQQLFILLLSSSFSLTQFLPSPLQPHCPATAHTHTHTLVSKFRTQIQMPVFRLFYSQTLVSLKGQ